MLSTSSSRRLALWLSTAALLITCAHAHAQSGPPKAVVRIAPAQMRPVDQRINATGRIRAVREAQVASREPGRVKSVAVRQGDRVKENDVLVILDDAVLKPEVTAARADAIRSLALLAEREADLSKAERDHARLTDLHSRASATENELLDGQTALQRARARRDQAKAESASDQAKASLLEQRLEDLTIRAPFAGQVVARDIDEGEWADRGRTVARIIDLDRLEAWIDVPERYLKPLTQSAPVLSISIPAIATTLQANADAILSMGDAATRTFPVRATIDNPEGVFRPGMTVTASIPTGEQAPMLLVPADALLRDDAGWYVFTATGQTAEDRAAVPARVETVFTFDALTVVRTLSGPLFPGAFVITEGNERILFPGQPLQIANPDVLNATPPPAQDNN
ncbi:MAG: efflux RND transporter periplasmic adaptor subunit [Phycisphaerales bacterium]